MDNPIITQVIEQMNDLPPRLQEQVLEFVATLRQTNSQNSDADAWDVLESLIGTIDAPPDWSSQHDHYLYGTPKTRETASPHSKQIDLATFAMIAREQLEAFRSDAEAFNTFAYLAGYYIEDNLEENFSDNRVRLHRILNGSEQMTKGEADMIFFAIEQLMQFALEQLRQQKYQTSNFGGQIRTHQWS